MVNEELHDEDSYSVPEGFWAKGYWGVRRPEPIKTILVKRSAEPIKTRIQIERSAKPIKTTEASTQAPPLRLLLARVHSVHFAPGTYSAACTNFQQVHAATTCWNSHALTLILTLTLTLTPTLTLP